jgi:hypothetical protein
VSRSAREGVVESSGRPRRVITFKVEVEQEEDGRWLAEVLELVRGGMSAWPSTRARRVLAALLRIGWAVKRQSGCL